MNNGTLAHFAINADDVERARGFYTKVFGWKSHAWGPPGFYMLDGTGLFAAAIQGRRNLVEGQKIGFECTIAVDSIDDTEQKVVAAGGKIIMKRSVIVGVGTLMFFQDTEGNAFGAMQYDQRAE